MDDFADSPAELFRAPLKTIKLAPVAKTKNQSLKHCYAGCKFKLRLSAFSILRPGQSQFENVHDSFFNDFWKLFLKNGSKLQIFCLLW